MPLKNPERAIAKLTGETHALFVFAQALARAHQFPQELMLQLRTVEHGLTELEPLPIDDAAIAAFQDMLSGIRRALTENQKYNPLPR